MVLGYAVRSGCSRLPSHGGLRALRSEFGHVRFYEAHDLLGLLVRNEPAGDLGAGLGGQHRLAALALESAPDSVKIKGGPSPRPFQGGVAGLAEQLVHAQLLLVLVVVERNRRNRGPVIVGERDHAVEESLYGDLAVGRPHGRQNTRKSVNRILHGAAGCARVHVRLGSLHIDLHAAQTLAGDEDLALGLAVLAAVGAESEIACQEVLVLPDEFRNLGTPDLLLSFKKELHIDGQRPFSLKHGLHSQNGDDHVALGVHGAAGVDPVSDYRRLEGRIGPELNRVSRLGIEVAI